MSNDWITDTFNDVAPQTFVDAGVGDVATITSDRGNLVADDARVCVTIGDIETEMAGVKLKKNQALIVVFRSAAVTAPLRIGYTITIGAQVFTVRARAAGYDEGGWSYICEM